MPSIKEVYVKEDDITGTPREGRTSSLIHDNSNDSDGAEYLSLVGGEEEERDKEENKRGSTYDPKGKSDLMTLRQLATFDNSPKMEFLGEFLLYCDIHRTQKSTTRRPYSHAQTHRHRHTDKQRATI